MIDEESKRLPRSGSAGAQIERDTAAWQRDAAIGRVSRTRGAVIAGAAGLTGGFALLVAALAPGHSLGATTHAATSTARTSSNRQPTMPPLANPATLGLQGPGAAPTSPPSESNPSTGSSSGSSQGSAPAVAVAPAPPVVSGGS
jgi:hypothetical protein